jgi:glutamate-ammonia-ligase adenylyltransferase
MEENRQTHTIPHGPEHQEKLARLMGFASSKAFQKVHETHRLLVRNIFERLLRAEKTLPKPKRPFPSGFKGLEAEWKQFLSAHGFRDVDKSFQMLREFVEGPGYVHVSNRTEEIALQLLAERFFSSQTDPLAPGKQSHGPKAKDERFTLSDPDRVMTRLDSFISAYGARGTLFELWNRSPAIFTLLVRLFDRSEFLAGLAITTPDLVDELVTSGRLEQRKTASETLADLRHGIQDADQFLWLRKYHNAEFMRIGLRDILGLADPEQYLVELSALADACLQYALEVVARRNKLTKPPFAIIGLGKLGGVEIDYGSDLDILFVADSKEKNLAKLAAIAREVMELLSRRTDRGILFHVDARLRPDGEKGLLVNSLAAFETYYRERAELWEIQTLTRARFAAGNETVGVEFQKLAAVITDFRQPKNPPAAFNSEWKRKIHHMRLRIEKERTPAGLDSLAIKTGAGGLVDAEFIAQALCLEHGWQEANTLRALIRGVESRLFKNGGTFLESYRNLRRLEGILRRWSYEGETLLPEDADALERVAIRAGFLKSEALLRASRAWRADIRKAYLGYFAGRHLIPLPPPTAKSKRPLQNKSRSGRQPPPNL